MCGTSVNWPDIPEPEYRREFDRHPKEMDLIFQYGMMIPHNYSRDRSIGHLMLELRDQQAKS